MSLSDLDILLKTFDTIKSWLEYAEKKNTVLFTIVAVEIGVLNFLRKGQAVYFLDPTFVLFLLALVIGMLSFYPKTDRLVFFRNRTAKTKDNLNLLFFEDIKILTPDLYIQSLKKQYNIGDDNNKLAYDLSEQIIILSRITSSKFIFFKIAFYLASAGQVSLFIAITFNDSL